MASEFESNNVVLNAPRIEVYNFLSDFRNFNNLISKQVKDWEATEDTCMFKAEGAGLVKLRYKFRSHSLIEIEPCMDLPVSGEIVLFVKMQDITEKTKVLVGAQVTIPPMFKMMLSRPLKKMLDMIAQGLEKHFNK